MLDAGCWRAGGGVVSSIQHPGTSILLIDDLLPHPDIRMRHERVIPAPPARVFTALRTADLAGSPFVKLLLAIRTLRWPKGPLTLDRVTQAGFKLVGERPGEEIVLGVVGKFWKPSGERRAAEREQFLYGAPPGEVLVAWSFDVRQQAAGHRQQATCLATETRIKCGDPATLRTFRRYWRIVHPGSALIRREMLRAVAREAGG
jgi:hypothetical protein